MSNKRITISISQIASLVGLDYYNNFPKIICEIWRKNYPLDFKLFETKLKEAGQQLATSNELDNILKLDKEMGTNIFKQVEDINSNKDKTSSDMVSQQAAIAKYINNDEKLATLNTKQKADIAKAVSSITNKNHGIINEDSILDEFCRLTEKTIKNTQDWLEIPIIKSKTISISQSHAHNWVLVGKYDAITNDNELVEAKMRQNTLFKKVRDYENIQVQLYLHALQFEQAYLVESITKKGNRQIYVNDIKYDSDYVNETILRRIDKFITFFELYMMDDAKDTTIKESLLGGDKDRKIYKIYERDYLGIVKYVEF